jgi:hypothetical protein
MRIDIQSHIDRVRNTLNGVVPKGKIQLATLRSLVRLTNTTKTISFQFRDVLDPTGLSIMLKDSNIAIAFAMGLGIAKVPTNENGTEVYFGNAQYISYPHTDVFSVSLPTASTARMPEVGAIQGFFNSNVKFETDQTTRMDSLSASIFMRNEQRTQQIDYGIKHVLLGSGFPMLGGKDNRITLTMPMSSDITHIGGSSNGVLGWHNYGVVELLCVHIITEGISSKENIINILAK